MISHLWRHRARARSVPETLLLWMRRARNLPALSALEWNKLQLRLKGVSVADTAVCSPMALQGENLVIGDYCSIGRIYAQAFGLITVGKCTVINDGVTLITGSHDLDSPTYRMFTTPITIKDYAWIAMNATLLPGVTIGEGAIVGAGSVVTGNVGDYEIVAGNPARKIRDRVRVQYSYLPSYWFGPVAAWVGLQPGQQPSEICR